MLAATQQSFVAVRFVSESLAALRTKRLGALSNQTQNGWLSTTHFILHVIGLIAIT